MKYAGTLISLNPENMHLIRNKVRIIHEIFYTEDSPNVESNFLYYKNQVAAILQEVANKMLPRKPQSDTISFGIEKRKQKLDNTELLMNIGHPNDERCHAEFTIHFKFLPSGIEVHQFYADLKVRKANTLAETPFVRELRKIEKKRRNKQRGFVRTVASRMGMHPPPLKRQDTTRMFEIAKRVA